jgi:hypothetical protein
MSAACGGDAISKGQKRDGCEERWSRAAWWTCLQKVTVLQGKHEFAAIVRSRMYGDRVASSFVTFDTEKVAAPWEMVSWAKISLRPILLVIVAQSEGGYF